VALVSRASFSNSLYLPSHAEIYNEICSDVNLGIISLCYDFFMRAVLDSHLSDPLLPYLRVIENVSGEINPSLNLMAAKSLNPLTVF
jgi:hypothetical protein